MEDPLTDYTVLYKMVALYDYTLQAPGDLEFSEGDTIDVLREGEGIRLSWAWKKRLFIVHSFYFHCIYPLMLSLFFFCSYLVIVNEEWLEGHCAGVIGIFPRSFAYREDTFTSPDQVKGADGLQKDTSWMACLFMLLCLLLSRELVENH